MQNTHFHETWPELSLDAWRETYATLHMWTQVVGKIRLVQSPWLNHSWNCTLHVTARGLTTGTMPYDSTTFQIEFDFIDHALCVKTSEGGSLRIALEPMSVADFYATLMSGLKSLGLQLKIHRMPNETANPVAFDEDTTHRVYDSKYANRFWQALVQSDRVFKVFRGRFIGKCSPVHYFWGAPDLAVTRFSGRLAPVHPGGVPNLPDRVTREAYSREVSSCGFWPGGDALPYPVFYSYAYPEPSGFSAAAVRPDEAFYSSGLGEFILPYDAVRSSSSPDDVLLEFLQTTYASAADLSNWDRGALETNTISKDQTAK